MRPPNIIFILIDDMGWRDLTCYSSSFYETPNIDRLAVEGIRFTDAYAACPVCSPTRASIHTGKYPATIGLTNFIPGETRGRLLEAPYIKYLPTTEFTLAKALREGGYQTWHVGKWHMGGREYWPEFHGFDVNIGGCDWGAPRKGYFSPWQLEGMVDPVENGIYLTDYLTSRAIELIENAGEKPFFLNLAHYAVHTPIQAPAELIAKYERKAAALGLDKQPQLVEGEHFPCEHKKGERVLRRILQGNPVYAAMVENLDANIGRLLASLEAAGQTQNTLIFFTSDNGGLATAEGSPTCNAPLAEGKGWMYEGGTREPLLVRWPGVIPAGTVCATPVTSPDFYPTILEAAGLPPRPDQHLDGESLMPLLRNKGCLTRDAIYWHYPHYGNQGGTPGSSLREGRYKLIEFFEGDRIELYDLEIDVSEERNLEKQEPELVARLQAKLAAWRGRVSAKLPKLNPDFWEVH